MYRYRLRPHHGLCLRFFRGEGYSEAFVKNMQEIVDTLAENPTIQLTSGCDSVCKTCPNQTNETDCICNEKVLRYDQMVAEHCGLTLYSILTWEEFSQRVNQYILTPNLREAICGDCQWSDLCKKIRQ